MTPKLLTFMRLLREQGVRLSVAEGLDALHGVSRVGLHDRELLRLSLRTALVKSHQDFATFDALFERFFTVPRRRRRGARRRGDASAGPGERSAPQANGSQSRSGQRTPPSPPPSSPSPTPRPSPDESLAAAPEGVPSPELETLAMLEQAWRQQLEAETGRPRPETHDFGDHPTHMRLDRAFPPDRLPDIYREVERLANRLVSRRALRYRRARRGTFDLRRTVLQGLRNGSEVPFALAYRRRHLTKLRLFVLCDVSGSVWQVSTFLLKLVQTLQAEFASVRSLVFVNSVVEVTPLFRHMRFPHDLDKLRHYPNLNLFGFSDFGRAFYQFYRDFLGELTRETVIVILGDARNNAFDPQAWTLEEISQRCRRIIWLHPEPRPQWHSGDAVLDAYAPSCEQVLECWTLEHLARAADLLFHP